LLHVAFSYATCVAKKNLQVAREHVTRHHVSCAILYQIATKCQQINMATKLRKKKAVAVLVLLELDKEREKKKQSRKVWVRPWIARREQKGCFHQVFIKFIYSTLFIA
jgi:hypothetical protein